MDEDHWWAGPDVKIREPLTMNENCFDREGLNRSACEWLEVGRNMCGRRTGRHEQSEETGKEQPPFPWRAWGGQERNVGTTPVG